MGCRGRASTLSAIGDLFDLFNFTADPEHFQGVLRPALAA